MIQKPEHRTSYIAMLNRGHIDLATKGVNEAIETYQKAIEVAAELGYADDSGHVFLLDNLKNDLHLFSRFETFPDTLLRTVADKMNIVFVPSYVPKEAMDSLKRTQLIERLAGEWQCQVDDVTVDLHVDPESEIFTYTYSTSTNEVGEFYKYVSECRFGRIGGELFWDEFCPMTDSNTFGKIIELGDDFFVLEIIENGSPTEKGQQRKYTRKEKLI